MNSRLKLTLGSLFAFTIIIIVIMTASSILKDEAVNNYLSIAKLNAKSMSKEINQDLLNIEQSIKNISSILNLYSYENSINTRLKDIQKNYPQIRSINILKEDKIVYSSNEYNLELIINKLNLFPQPIFDNNILKISTPWIGRDFYTASDVYTYEEKIMGNELFFIPISKKIDSDKGEFNIIVNLNSDYFINRFLTNIDSDKVVFELIRLDGVLLLSTESPKSIGKEIKETNLLKQTIETNEVSGIETINGNKYILTYVLTDDFPLTLSVKLDYEKNLVSWNQKQYNFFVIITLTIIIMMLIALYLFNLHNKGKEKELKLQKLQIQDHERFKLLFEDSHLLSVILDKDGKILDINYMALKFLNKKNIDIKGTYFWDLNCWDDNEKYFLKQLFENKENKSITAELKAINFKKENAILDFNLSTVNKEGIFNYIAIGQDITQKKEKEKKLLQAYTVFNNTHDGIMITDKYANMIDVNKSFENITGYIKSEIIGQNTRILKSNLHDVKFYKNMWDSITKKGFWEGEVINSNKSGEYYTEWLTINSVKDQSGNILNYIGIFSDITEQKHKDERLKENEKLIYQQSKMAAMGEMIENIAHQWRQPLSVISTAATGIKMQKELEVLTVEDENEALDAINESAQYLSNTIEDFRNYLNNSNEKEEFNIPETVESSLKLISSKLKNKNIKVIKNYVDIHVLGVKNEFIQVMINIITNAKDAFEKSDLNEKYLFITITNTENEIEIIIKDNAGGIPENIIEKVFEPYFTTKHQSQGTGIGLYMSSEIIKNHMNGTLNIQNEEYTYNNCKYIGASFIIKFHKS